MRQKHAGDKSNNTESSERTLSAKEVFAIIEQMEDRERERLGELLAIEEILPFWRVVKAHSLECIDEVGLSGIAAHLWWFLQPTGSKRGRAEVIRELWPDEAEKCPNLNLATKLRARLRQLVMKTNRKIKKVEPRYEIRTYQGWLFIFDKKRKLSVTNE